MQESNGKEETTTRIIVSIQISCLWCSLPHWQALLHLQIQELERRGTFIQFVFRNGGELQKQKIETVNRPTETESHNLLFMA